MMPCARGKFIWKARGHRIRLGERTLIMGIVNVTPDSFSGDGVLAPGRREKVPGLAHALELARAGADILDIGGASSRPGSVPPGDRVEAGRVLPLIAALAKQVRLPISVDTVSVLVALEALAAGASIVNLIQGTPADPQLLRAAGEARAGIILMHMRGTPLTMQTAAMTRYRDVVAEVKAELGMTLKDCAGFGVREESIVVDPGIGFAKTPQQNLKILRHLDEFALLGYPLLVGTSRKSFIGRVLGGKDDDRLVGTAATVALAAMSGAHIVRVHDVKAMKQAVLMADAIRTA